MSETNETEKVLKAKRKLSEKIALLAKAKEALAEADRAIAEHEAALAEEVKLRERIDQGEAEGDTAALLQAAVEKVRAASAKATAASSASYSAAIEAEEGVTGNRVLLEKAPLCRRGIALGKKILKLVVEIESPDYTERFDALCEQRARYTTGRDDHYAINSYIKLAEGWKELVNAYNYYRHSFNEWYLHFLSLSALHTLTACRNTPVDSGANPRPLPPKGYSTLVTLLAAEERTMTKADTKDSILLAARNLLAMEETARIMSRVFIGEDNALSLDPSGKSKRTLMSLLLMLQLITTAQAEYFAPIDFVLDFNELIPKAEHYRKAEALMKKSDITDEDFSFTVLEYVSLLRGVDFNGRTLV